MRCGVVWRDLALSADCSIWFQTANGAGYLAFYPLRFLSVLRVINDRKFTMFWKPVDTQEEPDYYKVVKHPLWLSDCLRKCNDVWDCAGVVLKGSRIGGVGLWELLEELDMVILAFTKGAVIL